MKLKSRAKPIHFSQEYLKESLDYDPDTGIFTWKERPLHHFTSARSHNFFRLRYAGQRAGHLSKKNGYRSIWLEGRLIREQRLAWFYMTGENPNFDIDHINHNPSDNRWCNLRKGDEINLRNKRRYKTNKTGYSGISVRENGKYRVTISVDIGGNKTKPKNFGTYSSLQEAVKVRNKVMRENGYDPSHGIAE